MHDAIAPGAKGHFGVAGDGAAGQRHLQEADVVDDGRGDARDEEAQGGYEEQEDAHAGWGGGGVSFCGKSE